MKKSIKHLLTGSVLLVAVIIAIASSSGGDTIAQNTTPDLKVSAIQLYNDFQNNEVSAKEKYGDKILEINGVIASIENYGDGAVVLINNYGNPDNVGIKAYFNEDQKKSITSLSNKMPITVIGKGSDDFLMFYDLNDCRLVNNQSVPSEASANSNATNFASISPSLREFQNQFNQYAKEVKLDIRMPEIKTEKDYPSKFNVNLNEYLILMGDLNKDNSIYDVVLMTSNDGSSETVSQQILTIGGMITAQNPNLKAEDRGRILKKLGLFADKLDLSTLNKSYTENDVTYKLYTIDKVLTFSITPEKGELTK